jgi:dynein assembly factor 3
VQVCPYDCRHTLATVSSHAAQATLDSLQESQQQPVQQQQQSQQQHNSKTQQKQLQQLHLYVYESEPEVLARHMLLLAVLFDAALPVRARAELFLELHGNAVLRQKSADYLGKLQPNAYCCSSQACVFVLTMQCSTCTSRAQPHWRC